MKVRRTTAAGVPAVWFECPGCGVVHLCRVERVAPHPAWTFNGDLDAPTLSPSIHVPAAGRRCHSFVTDGKIRFLSDCDHDLAGLTVELPDISEVGDGPAGVCEPY